MRLGVKAQRANRIAKTASDEDSCQAAYKVKVAALEQGIRCDAFRLRGDNLARPWLVTVLMPTGVSLHIPVRKLSRDIIDRPEIRVRLRSSAA